jgi:hypothetical protein
MFLLLPFVASHFLFYFSLHQPFDSTSFSVKKIPHHVSSSDHSMQALQLAKVKQVAKNSPPRSPSTDSFLFKSIFRVTDPIRFVAGHRYMMSCAAMEHNPPDSFPNRASPA